MTSLLHTVYKAYGGGGGEGGEEGEGEGGGGGGKKIIEYMKNQGFKA